MRKIILTLFILSTSLMAQVGGITGGKLNTPDAATLPSQVFEFEPSYTMGEAGSFGYRMSAGFGRYEVGVSLDNQAVMQNFGTKISMIENTLAMAVGVDYDTAFSAFAAGLIYSLAFSEAFTMDAMAAGNNIGDANGMVSFGYFITNRFQPIVELAFNQDSELSTVYGFTFILNPKVLLVVGVEQPITVEGDPSVGIAFTMGIE
ncbi:MAG: hypothetical protein QF847_08465 [Candidatus Marinimicrobia bacterium]|jgi:hypothetical protein|nr:hypothetical protein [Candidatus Neomarinimicrobiota bacterium]MDP6727260.1 hypothetical protein [Candidatus Neomarinimicrobiota bacterium]|tara:strand:+ start:128 stop:739 length:612 start_codon:yes stop_codon:yes gene_type:complete